MTYKRIIFCCCADYAKVSRDLIKQLYSRAKAAGAQVELGPDQATRCRCLRWQRSRFYCLWSVYRLYTQV
ncbi:MAG TPA: hypothetical protein DCG57_10415 [Candidatus Riflebacteria bacterium]|nr:hypothetical protein [Candidatus Riflebacteria bacterium]